jgi:hypothetical protein
MTNRIIISDIDDQTDPLGDLDNLFDDLPGSGPTTDQLYKMYGIFLNDIKNNQIIIKGVPLCFNRNISKHPVCRGKLKAFEHLITRGNDYTGKRDFDPERANRIHWIRPIIENVSDARIKYFECAADNGNNQQYYWYEEKHFIVIIREINPELMLITSFYIDKNEDLKFRRIYNGYKK